MSYICFDAFELGNHEFDDGDANLAKFVDLLRTPNQRCNGTDVLAANVSPHSNSALKNKIKSYTIKTLGNGEQIGIIGINIANKTMLSSSPDKGTILTDEIKAVKDAVAALESSKVNKIILLTHVGYDMDLSKLAVIAGVDVIVGGDSHTLLGKSTGSESFVGAPRGPYATMVGDTCVVTAWE